MTPLSASSKTPVNTTDSTVIARARGIIDIEIAGLERLKAKIDDDFTQAIELIEACNGRVIVTGMGKSGIIGQKIAATMSSTGTPALFLHPAEGSHGDLGTVTPDDVIIAISNSGETPEILAVLPLFKRFQLPIISITGRPQSTLGQQGNCVLDVSVEQEACSLGLAPTASTTNTLVMGDALAVTLLERKGFTPEDFALFHPAGSLGKKLLTQVKTLMHTGDAIPVVSQDASFSQALIEITSKKLGLVLVQNSQQQIVGIITDGDIRRALTNEQNTEKIAIADIMGTNPKSINEEALAAEALSIMETNRITSLVVKNNDQESIGVIHLHDILNAGIR